jgi:L-ribulose-5-phosphate 3-epimerase
MPMEKYPYQETVTDIFFESKMKRRTFLQQLAHGTAGCLFAAARSASAQRQDTETQNQLPYKIGIRQASLRNPKDLSKSMVANIDTFKVARDIPGISGVELQIASGRPNMRDLSVARRYKEGAHRWGMMIPSTAGVWSHTAWGPHSGLDLLDSIQATEILGARVMLVAFFRKNAPDMSDKQSYGPIVSLLKDVALHAQEAGVILGLENSLSPKDNKDLVDRIDHPSVKVYYDLDNMYYYGHGKEAVPGIQLLGLERIAAVHVKNNGRVLQDAWRINWASAFQAMTEIAYDGWLVFESRHKSHQECRKMTQQNIAFIKEHFRPPPG